MFDVDFALLNLNESDRTGLVFQKYFLDRLTPVFFYPRIKQLIEVPGMGAGCNIRIPLGPGNFQLLSAGNRQVVMNKSGGIMEELQLPVMAVDRRIKPQMYELTTAFPRIFGDNFIKALALVLLERTISRHDIKRVILVGEVEEYCDLIVATSQYGIPIGIQTLDPVHYEVVTYRLLYDHGCAVSNSYLNPGEWAQGELVMSLDALAYQFNILSPGVFFIRLDNNSRYMAPEIEADLTGASIDTALYNLAPILETCLLMQAGISFDYAEQTKAKVQNPQPLLVLKEAGERVGLWDLFLDKAI
ncbi:hypothetical protein [Syntrophomonas erecta]